MVSDGFRRTGRCRERIVLLAGSLLYAVVMVIVNGVKAHNGDEGPYALTIVFLS